jgi:hypothetical protein
MPSCVYFMNSMNMRARAGEAPAEFVLCQVLVVVSLFCNHSLILTSRYIFGPFSTLEHARLANLGKALSNPCRIARALLFSAFYYAGTPGYSRSYCIPFLIPRGTGGQIDNMKAARFSSPVWIIQWIFLFSASTRGRLPGPRLQGQEQKRYVFKSRNSEFNFLRSPRP